MTEDQGVWTAPKNGKINVYVDQFLSRSTDNTIVHCCIDECKRITQCNNHLVPAIFTFLCGKKANIFKYFSTPESVTIDVDNCLHFYFTDENNRRISENTPIVRYKMIYQ